MSCLFFSPRASNGRIVYAYTFTVTHQVLLQPAQVLHPLLKLLSYRFGPSEGIRPEPVNLAVAIRKRFIFFFFLAQKQTSPNVALKIVRSYKPPQVFNGRRACLTPYTRHYYISYSARVSQDRAVASRGRRMCVCYSFGYVWRRQPTIFHEPDVHATRNVLVGYQ